jgi:hypothetical protein
MSNVNTCIFLNILRNKSTLLKITFNDVIHKQPISEAARSKACVCGLLLSWIKGSNPTGGMDVCLL